MFLVVDKAPANLVNPRTGNVVAVFPETGIYFLYGTNDQGIVHTSSLVLSPKSVNVPIPGELTNIVGGYVGVEKKEPLIDAVVPASSFELYTTSSETYYEAPITLGFTPADGDLIIGTINGVNVGGEWLSGRADLKNDSGIKICDIRLRGDRVVVVVRQNSAPTTDYELHLYRHVPAGIVKIPQRYVDGLEETTANANQALEVATAAQNTAEAAQSTAESSRIAPNAYDYDAIQVSRSGKYKGWFESIPILEYDKANGKFHKSLWEKDALTYENIPKVFVIQQDNLQLGLGSEIIYMICKVIVDSSSNKWYVIGVGIGEKGSSFNAKTQYISLSESTGFVFEYTSPKETILRSSTSGSTKKFKITVDDTGTLKATEVT